MRFRQLNSNPNSIMRKKLVKSKKNWIVVSSLSLAGGLFLLGGPTSVVKAETATPATQTVQSQASSGTSHSGESSTASDSSATSAESTKADSATTTEAPATSADATSSVKQNTTPVVSENTNNEATQTGKQPTEEKTVQSIEQVKDGQESLATSTDVQNSGTDEISDQATPTSNNTDVVAAPEQSTPSADKEEALTSTVTEKTDQIVTEVPNDTTNLLSTTKALTSSKAMLASELLASDQVADSTAPIAEVTPVTPASGNGWNVDTTGTILNITGQLDEGTASSTNIEVPDSTSAPSKPGPTVIDDSSLPESKTNTLWGGNSQTITTINISSGAKAPENSSYIFSNMPKLTTITGLANLDTSKTTNMQGMFKNDTDLTTVDLSGNDVSSVTNMSHMFENDTNLKTTIYPGHLNNKGVTVIISTTAQYANNSSLTDPGVNQWQTRDILNTSSMFKNDSNIKNMNLGGWIEDYKPETGNSSIGQGMFDGTNLDSITLYNKMYFSPETALTSSTGSNWSNGSQTFSGIPTESKGGIGSVYIGSKSSIAGAGITSSTFTAQPGKVGDTTSNLITVQTNHGPISFEATGTIGSTSDVSSDLPSQITVDGNTYNLVPSQTVKATFGQTMSTAVLDANDQSITDTNPITYLGKDVGGETITVTTPGTTSSVDVNIPSGHSGDTTTIDTPKVTGYIPSSDKINVIYTDNGITTDASDITYTPVPAEAVTQTVATIDGTDITVDIPAGDYSIKGQTVSTPAVTGYTPSEPALKVTYDANGKASVDTSDLTYSPVKADASTQTVATIEGTPVTVDIPAGDYSIKGKSVPTPNVTGYTPSEPTLKVTYDANGKASVDTSDLTYSPVKADATTQTVTTIEGTPVTVDIPAGDYSIKGQTVPTPNVTGYTPSEPTLKVTYDANGKASVDTSDLTYSPVKADASSQTINTVNGGTANVTIPAGDYSIKGQTVPTPAVTGYTPSEPTLKITYDANGKASVDTSNLTYSPVKADATTQTVATIEGTPVTVDIPAGDYSIKGKSVPTPAVTGYTPNENTLKITYDANGKASVDTSDLTYSPVKADATTQTVTTIEGTPVTVDIPAGDYSVKGQTVPTPAVTGYTPSEPTLKVTYDANGKASVDTSDLTYSPVKSDATTQTVTTIEGTPVTVDIPAGDYSIKGQTVPTPKVNGYTVNEDTLPITYDENGKASVDTSNLTYTPVKSPESQTAIDTPDNKKVTIDVPAGDFSNKTTTVPVPKVPGYNSNLTELPVIYTADGTSIVDTSKLKYTKISTSHSSGSNNTTTNNNTPSETTSPEQNVQNIATYSDKGQINVYALGSDNKMSAIGNRGLAYQSTWYSDQKVTVDGIQYYRVATNEWVKASQVYPYEDVNFDVRTYDKTAKVLYKSEDEIINNRMLAPNTSWFSDRVTYVINGEKYYRVATNEFVSAKDTYVYEPTNMVVTTNVNIAATALYSAKGELVTNRSLAADTSWLVDSITYINGIKYYRVATNEFVKATDVDTNY